MRGGVGCCYWKPIQRTLEIVSGENFFEMERFQTVLLIV